MPDRNRPEAFSAQCSHENTLYRKWGRASWSFDWGRRKIREIAIIERMMHLEQRLHHLERYGVDQKDAKRYYRVSEAERRFAVLAQQWYDETAHLSSSARILSNQNYLSIIAMGQQALPGILRRLRDSPEPWFPALAAITSENPPLRPDDTGEFQRMRQAWLDWGSDRGMI
jgi:hypothetical protein